MGELVTQQDQILEAKAVIKQIIGHLEGALGIGKAYPACSKLVAAVDELDKLRRIGRVAPKEEK